MLIKRITLLVMIFTLSLSTFALAAEPDNGIIEGQIVNGTEGGSSVGDVEITLKTYLDDAEVSSATAKTDAAGKFVFDGLATGPGYSYQVELTYQQADYTGDRLSFDDGETTKFTGITVYDSTVSDEAIKVMTAHTVIYIEQNSLWITEYFLFVNEADRTYIGSKEINAEGTRKTLGFSLPKEASEFQPEYGLMECCIFDSEGGFIDTMPVIPGGQEVVYSYRVSYNSGAYTLSQNVNYPIINYDFLVQGENTKAISDQLTTGEALNIEGTWFNHLSGKNLTRGNILVTQLSNLPETENQGTVKWVALALVVLACGFGFGYLQRKKRVQPVRVEENLAQRKQRLLAELAQLDDNFEGSKIPEEVYRRQRAAKKAQLAELLQRSKRR